MRSIRLKNPQYQLLQKGFENWLRILGYAESTVYSSPSQVKPFLAFLEQRNITGLHQVSKGDILSYIDYLNGRKNQRQGGGLSVNYLISNINALKRFARYLRETKSLNLEIDIKLPKQTESIKTILTPAEIEALYKACPVNDHRWKYASLGLRDKAMLGVFYGCGLRRSEGLFLNVNDIDFSSRIVHIRKGKGYKERFVPISSQVLQDFKAWLTVREQHQIKQGEQSFLISHRGSGISGNTLLARLKSLSLLAGIDKEIGLHTLRHSIATHLLHKGMSLENVSAFLGHSSLENTQIYTHLKYESF